jgi:hypothetical protein
VVFPREVLGKNPKVRIYIICKHPVVLLLQQKDFINVNHHNKRSQITIDENPLHVLTPFFSQQHHIEVNIATLEAL